MISSFKCALSSILALALFFCAPIAFAADIDGATLSLAWSLPFLGVLLSIAIFPIMAPYFWHHHFGKVAAFWVIAFLLPYALVFDINAAWALVTHALLAEYLSFIILLFALYTISGGILVWGRLNGTPKMNTSLLALGTLLASIMGTTGAAMLLIRPLIKANKNRQYNVHIVVFFIFLVANIGGGITPLGDPPLFIGFLKGVSFAWTVQHMALPVLFISTLLLTIFYFVDRYFYRKDIVVAPMPRPSTRFKLYGTYNFVLILGVVGLVLLSGVWQPKLNVSLLGVALSLQSLVRDGGMLLLALISLFITPKQIRAGNDFNWAPISEVAKLFAAIFITIAPVIALLHAGQAGGFAVILRAVSDTQGQPINAMYFWITGILSSFLDNAPTYLVFFNLAHGDPVTMMGPLSSTLLAISMGAVFMGANTYIGNAPNFMVKAIAEQNQIKMPGFFGYMLWSFCILIPLFLVTTWLFF
jgi:Na+/H+ antiporter NhaD/arsenite permease-like protein